MRRVGIVGFHGFSKRLSFSGSTVTSSHFIKAVANLLSLGYTFRTLSEMKYHDCDDKCVYLYFDDCDYSVYELITEHLKAYEFKATLFPVSHYINGTGMFDVIDRNRTLMSADNLRFLIDKGFEIGSHSATHIPLAIAKNRALWGDEIAGSKKELEDIFNCTVNFFSAPYGNYTSEMVDFALECGYEAVITINETFTNKEGLFVGYPAYNLDSSSTIVDKATKGSLLTNINALLYNQFSKGSVLLKS